MQPKVLIPGGCILAAEHWINPNKGKAQVSKAQERRFDSEGETGIQVLRGPTRNVQMEQQQEEERIGAAHMSTLQFKDRVPVHCVQVMVRRRCLLRQHQQETNLRTTPVGCSPRRKTTSTNPDSAVSLNETRRSFTTGCAEQLLPYRPPETTQQDGPCVAYKKSKTDKESTE